ncbi:MAG: hypothetical protein EOO46_13900 [Flavobacterium sp.]|nr:MAG: hypothetical protein EOO46_13900 [Flavobacterium sp.]
MIKTLKLIIAPLWIAAFAAVACMKKEAIDTLPHPAMEYTDLNGLEIGDREYYNLDVDANGTVDFTFSTRSVGDPILKQDRLQYLAGSKIETNLLNNANDDSPKMVRGEKIGINHKGYNWYELSSVLLAEKVNPLEGASWWQGVWKDADHNYLPLQLIKAGKLYHGWVEISFNALKGKLVLHKAAICTESNKEIKAGF